MLGQAAAWHRLQLYPVAVARRWSAQAGAAARPVFVLNANYFLQQDLVSVERKEPDLALVGTGRRGGSPVAPGERPPGTWRLIRASVPQAFGD